MELLAAVGRRFANSLVFSKRTPVKEAKYTRHPSFENPVMLCRGFVSFGRSRILRVRCWLRS
jgi:hypothetical protein